MTKHVTSSTYNTILEAAKRADQGVCLEDIVRTKIPPISRRTAQRYIAYLIKEGHLIASGKGPSRRYFFQTLPSKENKESLIPLSSQAKLIESSVQQPIQKRLPIGYNRDFLDKYRPNETFYLSKSIRKHLLEKGKLTEEIPLTATYNQEILNRLLIDLSWNSSRLEGNTYSLLETERLLELGETPEGKDSKEAQMILNHKAAIEFIVESKEQLLFNSFIVCNVHALLSDNLLQDPRGCGKLRSTPVGIAKSVYKPITIPGLIEECFTQILDTAKSIKDPFEQSFFILVHLPYLQPFIDVNKRVSRLVCNIPFIRKNPPLSPLSFVDVPEDLYISGLLGIYELNRVELLRDVFVWAYERSSALYSATRQELGEPNPFRLRHRALIIATVGEIIRGCLDKKKAILAIKQKSTEFIPIHERAKFVEIMENELMSLHQGNIARFRLTLSEYELWMKTWR